MFLLIAKKTRNNKPADTLRVLARRKLKIGVVGVATVQEEVGLRGAITSAYTTKPDAGIAIDVGFATDHPEANPKQTGDVKLDGGPEICRGPNINPVLYQSLIQTAKRLKMPVQLTGAARATGTDANAMQLTRGGAATALISIPNRYMHSPAEVVSLKDAENAAKLIAQFIIDLKPKQKFIS